jgi:hypothetical protein
VADIQRVKYLKIEETSVDEAVAILLAPFPEPGTCHDTTTGAIYPMPRNASDNFLTAFAGIAGTGNFHSTGTAPYFLPQLHVTGLGELAFPLTAAQAKALISLAEAAPYGKGDHTYATCLVLFC